MKHYFSGRVRLVLVLALLLAVIVAVISGLTGLSLPDMVVQGVLTPVRTGVSKIADKVEQGYSYVFEYEALVAENEALKEQLAQLEDNARQAAVLERENEYLRSILELKEIDESYEFVDGYVIGRSSQDWTSTITINRGANAGIEEGMCVVTANHEMVGLVSQVGSNYAVIKTVLDSSLEISATIASSGYSGMVQGGYSSGLSGLLRMDYLPSAASIRNNDQVVTTGSTVYPRGLILGYVVDAGFDDSGIAKYALLEPAARISSLEQVFVVTAYDAG